MQWLQLQMKMQMVVGLEAEKRLATEKRADRRREERGKPEREMEPFDGDGLRKIGKQRQ